MQFWDVKSNDSYEDRDLEGPIQVTIRIFEIFGLGRVGTIPWGRGGRGAGRIPRTGIIHIHIYIYIFMKNMDIHTYQYGYKESY